MKFSDLSERLGHSLSVLGVDISSRLTTLPRCDVLTVRFHSIGWIKVRHLPNSGQGLLSSDGNASLTLNAELFIGCQGVELIPKAFLHIL